MSSPADVKAKLPKRVADYFIVVGFGAAGQGEDARVRGRTVKGLGLPIILDRFPREDWKDAEFPKKCAAFCFPTPVMGFSKEKVEPESFSFVMTDSDGTRLYGSAYVIWDEVSPKMWGPRCLCLVSHWPFCNQFHRFLSQLHRGMGAGLKYPLERLILNFICEVPLPPEGKLIVRYKSLPSPLEFCRPPPNKPPLRDFELFTLFEYLSVDNVLSLFSAVMTERSILFTSSKYQTLMNACQASTHLCCPFFWRHIYIPVLPQSMADVVCAPMPFMVGMLEKSRPDILMLNNVLIVDLDKNSIMTSGDVTIPPLPKDRFMALLRQLKKLTGDTSSPIKGNINLDSAEIETIFLKFHAKLFKNYRDYMEAPSDYVIDRFDKNKFVAQHVERGPFLTEFMLTQMFQCFVDERYELTAAHSQAKGRHLEILFFDEYIDKVHKKPTPFLGDTSLAHAAEAYNVLLPNDTGKMPTPTATNLFQYSTFPNKMDDAFFGQARVVAPLVTDDDVSSGRGDMSKLSMKFFTEKRMYSQHFHALRVRSNKQDVAFNDISRYFKAAQALDEQQIQQFHQMCLGSICKDTIETQSSIDGPWSSLKSYVNNKDAQEVEAFKMLREEVCTPLYSSCSEASHLLSIRFAEANKLEAKASGGKTDVERAKAVRDILVRKWLDLKTQYAEATLSPSDITRLVAVHNEAETAVMSLDLLEVDFQNIVNEYEARMPDIITTIRKLNGKRINAFKTALTAWCIAQRVQLHSSISHLDELEKEVQQIDAVKDLKSFMTGTADFWASDRRASIAVLEMLGAVGSSGPPGPPPGGPSNAPPPPPPRAEPDTKESHALDPNELSSAHLRRFTIGGAQLAKESLNGIPKCYPISLWGHEGYALAEEQTRFTIETVDEFACMLEEWGKAQELMSTRMTNLVKNSTNASVNNDTRFRVWLSLKARVDIRAKNYAFFARSLAKLAGDLQLAKNQTKVMIRRFADYRLKLERDVADQHDFKLKAYSKQQAARKAFEQLDNTKGAEKDPTLTIAELERRTQRFDRLSKELNEAEAAYALADRAKDAIKVRQDVCTGRMLSALEEKEKEIGCILQSGVMFIMEQCSKFYVTSLVESDENLEARIKQVDYSVDLRDVVMSCYDKNVPQHERLKDDEPIDLGVNLGWSRFHVAVDVFSRTGVLTKCFSSLIAELAAHTETFAKSLRKLPFEIKTCTAPSLGRAFQEFHKVARELCDNLEQEVKNLRDVNKIFVKQQDTIRLDLRAHQKAYADMDAAYTKAIRDQLKTEKDVVDAEANMKAAEQRLARAKEKKETTDLQIKAGYAKQNYENLKEVQLKKADEHLLHAAKFRTLAVAGLLRQMQSEEEQRCKVQVGTLVNLVDFHKRRVIKFDKTLEGLFNKISAVDVNADILDFLTSRKPAGEIPKPPDVVVADLRFRLATAPPKVNIVRQKPQALPAPDRHSFNSTSSPKGTLASTPENGKESKLSDGKESDEDEPSRGATRERSVGIIEPDALEGDPDERFESNSVAIKSN